MPIDPNTFGQGTSNIGSQLGQSFTMTGQSGAGGASTGGFTGGMAGGSGGGGFGGFGGGNSGGPNYGQYIQAGAQLLNQFGVGSSSNGGAGSAPQPASGWSNALNGGMQGASYGSAGGIWGTIIGAAAGATHAIIGGGTVPQEETDAWKAASLQALAQRHGVSIPFVAELIRWECERDSKSFEDVERWFREDPDGSRFRNHVAFYQRSNGGRLPGPGGAPAPAGGAGGGFNLSPMPGNSFAANSFGGGGGAPAQPTLQDYANGAYSGLIKGVGDVFGQSQTGKQMQNDGAKQWLERNWYVPTSLAGAFVFLAYKAFSK